MAKINVVQTRLSSVIEYLGPLLPLANCHMVNFFTENYWKKFISSDVQNEYQKIGLTGLYEMFGLTSKSSLPESNESELITNFPFLTQYLSSVRRMSLSSMNDVSLSYSEFQEKLKSLGFHSESSLQINEFMSPKKLHEVEVMSDVVAAITEISTSSHIIDVGSGKGYLSSMLALQHGLRVVGVDSSQINSHGAVKRTEKLQKYWPGLCRRAMEKSNHHSPAKRGKHWKSKSQSSLCSTESKDSDIGEDSSLENFRPTTNTTSLYKQITLYISENTDVEKAVRETFPNEATNSIALVGLHTCGNLAATSLKLFAQNDYLKALCNVGCCYHHIEEEFSPNPFCAQTTTKNTEFGFPMSEFLKCQKFAIGRNVRMLAAQSVDRLSEKKEIPVTSLFYRALLQVILKEETGEDRSDWNVGRIAAKCKSFKDYCEKSFRKLNIDLKLSDSKILSIHDQYLERRDELEAFYLFRVSLAPVIETVIMLDRLLYLLEQDIKEANIVQLFNPVISPRCYGIIALKDFCEIKS